MRIEDLQSLINQISSTSSQHLQAIANSSHLANTSQQSSEARITETQATTSSEEGIEGSPSPAGSPAKLRRDRSKRIYVDNSDDNEAAQLHTSLTRAVKHQYMRWLEITSDRQAQILHQVLGKGDSSYMASQDSALFRRCWQLVGNWTKLFQNVALNKFTAHVRAIKESNQLFASSDVTVRREFLASQYTPETLGELLPFSDDIIDFTKSARNDLVNKYFKNLYIYIADMTFQCLDCDRTPLCTLWRSFAFAETWAELKDTDFVLKMPKPTNAKRTSKKVKKAVEELVEDFAVFE